MQTAGQDLTLEEYRELAEFRYQISERGRRCERAAQEMGIRSNLYLLLLTVQGLPEGALPTMTTLAQRMCLPPMTMSALVDEAAGQVLVTRSSNMGDGTDWIKLTRAGRETLHRITIAVREDLEMAGPDLACALQAVIRQRRKKGRKVA
ncbi:MAG: hypothetical protein ABJC09_17190 [Terriglobia bacterium]